MKRLAASFALLGAACASPAPDAEPDWSAVRVELARRVAEDQAVRAQFQVGAELDHALLERWTAIDADNTAWLKALVERHGWPTSARVGVEGAGDAWLLVQHADHDVDFQEHCLALLAAAVESGQADQKNLAYLHDRVAMHRGRPQRYGTQFVQKDGGFAPYTLEDPARVDEWRAGVGLGTLAEYAELLKSP